MAAPTRVGSWSASRASGRVATATTAATTNSTAPMRPATGRRRATRPSPAANNAATTNMPISRATLSLVPNDLIAQSLSQPGVASMNASASPVSGAAFTEKKFQRSPITADN